jgi:hypothetical protein
LVPLSRSHLVSIKQKDCHCQVILLVVLSIVILVASVHNIVLVVALVVKIRGEKGKIVYLFLKIEEEERKRPLA